MRAAGNHDVSWIQSRPDQVTVDPVKAVTPLPGPRPGRHRDHWRAKLEKRHTNPPPMGERENNFNDPDPIAGKTGYPSEKNLLRESLG